MNSTDRYPHKHLFCAEHQDVNISRSDGFCEECQAHKVNLNDIIAGSLDIIETYKCLIDHLHKSKDLVVRRVDRNGNPQPSERATQATTLFVVSYCMQYLKNKRQS